MEKRAILAAVLMAAVFIVYQAFFFPEPPPQKPPAQSATQLPGAPRDPRRSGQAGARRGRPTLRFHPDGYAFDATIRVENPGAAPRTTVLSIPSLSRQTSRATPEKFQGQHPTEIVVATQGSV